MSGRRKRRAKTQSVKAKKKEWVDWPRRICYGPSRFSGLYANLRAFEEIKGMLIRHFQQGAMPSLDQDKGNFATLPKSEWIDDSDVWLSNVVPGDMKKGEAPTAEITITILPKLDLD